ncbi:lysozyme inhibitor LprI family protein [Maritimibacter fusiformis]|uniref:DUF1311 domain-containing protein n=1 Tax=Maritimibacter fusiformis TaxID=2603819 RepID=A0A5D0RRE8_9RHOB|nr:lysozyme inhibitor LprI family protein [Maritimibacter fusiformis]TYB83546.1 DUF1311 domain-containing protein [Maritimibacter fusiformis]
MKRYLALALALTASPAAAQDMVFDGARIAACRAAPPGNDPKACIGVEAERCMSETEGGISTAGMSACLGLELDWWDARLNEVYREVRTAARDMDATAGDYAPSQADALLEMQRAWIAFRDGRCAYERSWWGGGTGGGPATAGCLLQMTAEQVIYLEGVGLY